ncbi:MAG TPA: sialidase family protein, partial [Gammaproteobacteria bacterium]|nr:sialidase family protein [Gammaproteobacteria bacterium]
MKIRTSARCEFVLHCLLAGLFALSAMSAQATVTFTDVNPDSSTLDPTDPDGASGGRVNGLASVAADNQTIYAATEFGGLYRSTDGGLTWNRLDGHMPVATWDVKVDPVSTSTVYATSFFDGRTTPITGIQVSYDGGLTWNHPATAHPDPALEGTGQDNTPDPGFSCSATRRTEPSAFGIAIQPDAPQTVYVGTNCGLAITDDSGTTWRFIDPSPTDPADDVWDVVAQPGGIVDICGDDGHLRSTDGGLTWIAGSGLPSGRCSMAVSLDESYVLLVAASDNNIYESDNGGTTWTNLGTPDRRRQGRTPFAAVNDRAGAAFDLWYGDVSLFRGGCTTPSPAAPGGANRCPAGRVTPATPPPAGWAGPFTRGTGAHDDVGAIVFDTEATIDACPTVFA